MGRVALASGIAFSAFAALAACTSFRATPSSSGGAADGGDDAGGDAAAPTFTIAYQGDADAGAIRALWAESATNVYAAGDDGVVFHFAGDTGPAAADSLGKGVDLGGIWGSGPAEILAVATQRGTDKGPIFRKSGAGRWIEIGTAPHGLRAVFGVGNMRFASGNDGVIYYGSPTDPLGNGTQMSAAPGVPPTPLAPIIWSLGGNSEHAVMAAVDVDTTAFWDGTIWHSYDDPIDRTRAFRAIWGYPGDGIDVYEGANYYGLWHFTGKQNPVVQVNEEKDDPTKASLSIWGIWGPSKGKVIAVGDGGRIMTYDDATQVLTVLPSPTTANLYAVTGTSESDVWIVGEHQLVLHGRMP